MHLSKILPQLEPIESFFAPPPLGAVERRSNRRIVISSYDDLKNPYYGGGGAVSIHQIAKRLAKRFSVTVLTSKYPGSNDETIDGISYIRIGLTSAGPFLGQLIFQLALPYYVKNLEYDLWIESFTPPFSTTFLPLFTRKKVIGLAHMLSARDMKRKYKLPFDLFENLGLKTYKNFIVMTENMRDQIRSQNRGAEIIVVGNGINQPKKYGLKEKNYILFLGRIEVNQKGLDLLLQSFSLIKHKTAINLLIAGTGTTNNLKLLNSLIKENGLSERVKLLGRISGENKNKLISESLFLVMPSRYESFGMVALEGFSFKKPVVTFNLDMLNWIPDNCSLKATPFEIQDYAKLLKKLIENHQLRKRLGQNAYKLSNQHSWDEIYLKYEKFIDKILTQMADTKSFRLNPLNTI